MPHETSMLRLYVMRVVYLMNFVLLAVALPSWSSVRSTDLAGAMVIGVVLDLIAIPWPYVWRPFITGSGDRWSHDRVRRVSAEHAP